MSCRAEILIFLAAIFLLAIGIYLGEMNIKRIAIERGVAQTNQAGEFEFKQGAVESRKYKTPGCC